MADKVAFEFDPFEKFDAKIAKGKKREAKAAIKDFIREKALSYIGKGQSPVEGGAWKRALTNEYSKKKKGRSSANYANLELRGAMLNALDVVSTGPDTMSYQVAGSQAGKADGNNRGTYGHSDRTNRSKAREFIPRGRQTFRSEIWDGVERIVKEFEEES